MQIHAIAEASDNWEELVSMLKKKNKELGIIKLKGIRSAIFQEISLIENHN